MSKFQPFGRGQQWRPSASTVTRTGSIPHVPGSSGLSHTRWTDVLYLQSPRCSASLTHSDQRMSHKHVLSQQMVSLSRENNHQELTASMQYSPWRQITNQIITAVFEKHKYWATLITCYLICAKQQSQDLCSTYILKYPPKGDKRAWTEGLLFSPKQHTVRASGPAQTPRFHRVCPTGPSTQQLRSTKLLLFQWISY